MKIGENPRKLCIFNPIPAVGGGGGFPGTQLKKYWSEAALLFYLTSAPYVL